MPAMLEYFSGCYFDRVIVIGVLFRMKQPNLVRIGHLRRSDDDNFKMAAAVAQCYLRLRIWWCHSLPKVKIYPQTKFRRRILIHGWDITTTGLEKQTSTILEFFQLRLRLHHCNRHAILHKSTNFYPNRATRGGAMTSYTFSRWRPRQLHTTPILLPVSHLMMSLSCEDQNLSANQISLMYLNPWQRYNDFRFWKTNVRHIEILLPFAILTRSLWFACYSE